MARAGTGSLAGLLTFVLLAFAANSLITRHVVTERLLDPGLLTGVRMIAGAAALVGVAVVRGERVSIGRANLVPTAALGAYAVFISYGYRFIGAAAGTFVFYATVMLTLIAFDVRTRTPIPRRRWLGAGISLAGIAVLSAGRIDDVTVLGVLLLAVTGVAWGAYTAAGRTAGDPRRATTGNFALLGEQLSWTLLVAAVLVAVRLWLNRPDR